jgi:hypothetical protein
MLPAKRFIFKGMFAPLIRDAFNLGLRNNVIDQATNHQTAGWKGVYVLFSWRNWLRRAQKRKNPLAGFPNNRKPHALALERI